MTALSLCRPDVHNTCHSLKMHVRAPGQLFPRQTRCLRTWRRVTERAYAVDRLSKDIFLHYFSGSFFSGCFCLD